jgi:phosphomannomutase
MQLRFFPQHIPASYKEKTLVVFDLDGTLTSSKMPMDTEMAQLVARLIAMKRVAVIGGGKFSLFKQQLIAPLLERGSPAGSQLRKYSRKFFKNLFLFPTTSTAFYCYNRGWRSVYIHRLSKKERAEIKRAFQVVFKNVGYIHPKKVYGKIIEDRGTQITFSALGQHAPLAVKKRAKRSKSHEVLRRRIASELQKLLPDFDIRLGGLTSIDVTRKGIDKAYGLRQIKKYLRVPIKKMVFIGDDLSPGGNDYAVRNTGVDCVAVRGPKDTKRVIREIISMKSGRTPTGIN